MLAAQSAWAFDGVSYAVRGPNGDESERLEGLVRSASQLQVAEDEDRTDPQELIAAALADYSNILNALYAEGYYGPVISIQADGREISDIQLLNVPQDFGRVWVRVQTGPQFTFSRTDITPRARGTELPDEFAPGEIARASIVGDAVDASIDAWRERGHAKAAVASEDVRAQHERETLSVDIGLAPGPVVTFGDLILTSESAVRASAIRRIAGFPAGQRFDPVDAARVADRLRRTGAFSSVTLTEGDLRQPGNVMDMTLQTADQKPRRIGFGAEVSTLDGAAVSAFWLHRNFFGGAERLRFDAEVSNIGSSESGMDYLVSGRLEIPAIYGADTDGYVQGRILREDEPTYLSERVELGVGATRIISETLEAEVGVTFIRSRTVDDLGERDFTLLAFPAQLTFDTRDNELNPKQGVYVTASTTPFLGLADSASGARLNGDARLYWGFGDNDPNVLAARLQLGAVVGSELDETPPDFLFYSGGGGTVRGQPYQSLFVTLDDGTEIGGRGFLGLSTEFRREVTRSIGAVAFYDAGYISPDPGFGGTDNAEGEWHSGAGIGLRYNTGIGPIRFDVATPTSGETGDGIQFYIGIGQAF
ncbi:autotransporter assembly complex protein TamA [Litorisediminicola beolgyonensis]|uniref:autotransporter assembly complex protein TamA n=1 Tax=Litorisediminicola beolgyonensis TaxID=1173614 RepID=UPI0036D80FB1